MSTYCEIKEVELHLSDDLCNTAAKKLQCKAPVSDVPQSTAPTT